MQIRNLNDSNLITFTTHQHELCAQIPRRPFFNRNHRRSPIIIIVNLKRNPISNTLGSWFMGGGGWLTLIFLGTFFKEVNVRGVGGSIFQCPQMDRVFQHFMLRINVSPRRFSFLLMLFLFTFRTIRKTYKRVFVLSVKVRQGHVLFFFSESSRGTARKRVGVSNFVGRLVGQHAVTEVAGGETPQEPGQVVVEGGRDPGHDSGVSLGPTTSHLLPPLPQKTENKTFQTLRLNKVPYECSNTPGFDPRTWTRPGTFHHSSNGRERLGQSPRGAGWKGPE